MSLVLRRTRRILFVVGVLLAASAWLSGFIGMRRGMTIAADSRSENEWLIAPDDPAFLWNGRVVVCLQAYSRLQVYDLDGRLVLVRNPGAVKRYTVEFYNDKLVTYSPPKREYRTYDRDFRLVGQRFESNRSPPLKPRHDGALPLTVQATVFGASVDLSDVAGKRRVQLQPASLDRVLHRPVPGWIFVPMFLIGALLLAASSWIRRQEQPQTSQIIPTSSLSKDALEKV